ALRATARALRTTARHPTGLPETRSSPPRKGYPPVLLAAASTKVCRSNLRRTCSVGPSLGGGVSILAAGFVFGFPLGSPFRHPFIWPQCPASQIHQPRCASRPPPRGPPWPARANSGNLAARCPRWSCTNLQRTAEKE